IDDVHRYEGTVNQILGDGIMALFGAPVAHEDHAVRACHAALRIQETIERYAADLRGDQGIDVQVRIGLNSGEVVVRSIRNDLHMDYSAVGQTAHLAARMEQLARPGMTFITTSTLHSAQDFIDVKPLGTVPVKGLEKPVPVYALIAARHGRTRFQTATATPGLSHFIGRAAEIATLGQAVDRIERGHGQVVTLVGTTELGQSR